MLKKFGSIYNKEAALGLKGLFVDNFEKLLGENYSDTTSLTKLDNAPMDRRLWIITLANKPGGNGADRWRINFW